MSKYNVSYYSQDNQCESETVEAANLPGVQSIVRAKFYDDDVFLTLDEDGAGNSTQDTMVACTSRLVVKSHVQVVKITPFAESAWRTRSG